MGFATGVSAMVSQSITYATQLFGDFGPYFALMVGVAMLGTMVGWFLSR